MKNILKQLGLAAFAAFALTLSISTPTHAYSNTRLMDDTIFDNVSSMNEQQIRDFINSRPNTCLTKVGQNLGGGNIYPEPKDYFTYGPNLVDAARVIYIAAQYNNLNPQVILATLQKEQTLMTDNDCLDINGVFRLPKAMGQGCPDGGACPAPAYAGFHQQVMKGAWQLKFNKERAVGNVEWGDNGSITYPSPYTEGNRKNCSTCALVYRDGYMTVDGQLIKLETGATASFYRFTPHLGQALPSIFEGWFGPTTGDSSSIIFSRGLTLSKTSGLVYNDTVTASFEVQNTASYAVNAGGFGVCARLNGAPYDFGFVDSNNIPAGGKITISFAKRIDAPGNLLIFSCSYNDALGGWSSARYPYSTTSGTVRSITLTVGDNPLISTGITLTPSNPAVGQLVTATTSITNSSTNPISIGSIIIAGRDSRNQNVDFAEDANVTISAGGTYTYSKIRSFASAGATNFFIVNWRGGTYDQTYPKSLNSSIVRKTTITVLDNPVMSTGISLSPTNPSVGQPVTATMTFRNASPQPINIGSIVVAARGPNGNNEDFGITNDVIVPASSSFTYSQTRTLGSVGRYSLFAAHWDKVWDTAYPKSADSSVNRTATLTTSDNPLLTAGISLSTTTPTVGNPVTAMLSIKNASSVAVTIGSIIISARDPLGKNVDFPEEATITIPANSTYLYSKSRTFMLAGMYSLSVVNWRGAGYDHTYPKSADGTIIRQTIMQVN